MGLGGLGLEVMAGCIELLDQHTAGACSLRLEKNTSRNSLRSTLSRDNDPVLLFNPSDLMARKAFSYSAIAAHCEHTQPDQA